MRILRFLISLVLVVTVSKFVVVPVSLSPFGHKGVDIAEIQMAIEKACPEYKLRGIRESHWVYSDSKLVGVRLVIDCVEQKYFTKY